ncbi:MAG: cellulose-binding domain-containing protein [Clostridia bacterium]|nr:cellulose-binding domain-containing protein [Clostridia bacterium]
MKKVKVISFAVAFVFLFSAVMPLNVFAGTETVKTYIKVLTSASSLKDGDKMIFQNQNTTGKSWLFWYMGGNNGFYPMLKTVINAPPPNAYGYEFTVKALSNGKFGFYIISPYSGQPYFINYTGSLTQAGLSSVPLECTFDVGAGSNPSQGGILCSQFKVPYGPNNTLSTLYLCASTSAIGCAPGAVGSVDNKMFWKMYKGENAEVTFNLGSSWSTGFSGTVTITNKGTAAINDWTAEFRVSTTNKVTSIYDAVITLVDGTRYVVKNAGWNSTIPVGGSVTFGFNASGAYSSPWLFGVAGTMQYQP